MREIDLPDTAGNIVRLIGEPEALKLMEAFPKINYRIPRNPEKAEKLNNILSYKAVQILCKEYDGELLYIPDAAYILRKYRDQKIRDAHGKKSVNELAREYGLSYRRIQQIQEPVKEALDDRQVSLF